MYKIKHYAKKCEWVSECAQCNDGRMHALWTNAPQWCAWQQQQQREEKKKKEEEVQNTHMDTVWGNIIFSWNEWEYSNGEDVEIISGLNIVEQFFDLLIYEVAPHFTSHDSVLEITTEHNKRPFLIW